MYHHAELQKYIGHLSGFQPYKPRFLNPLIS